MHPGLIAVLIAAAPLPVRFDQAKVKHLLDAASPKLNACLSRCQGQACLGTFELSLKVEAGHAAQVELEPSSSIQSPAVVECAKGVVQQLDIPMPRGVDAAPLSLFFSAGARDAESPVRLRAWTLEDEDPGRIAQIGRGQKISTAGAPSTGPAGAPVTLVVFSDFECSFCVRAEATVHRLLAAYPDKVRFVFRNKPMPENPHARLAARAGRAADVQGRFWEYEQLLFAHTGALDRSSLVRWAKQAGLDTARFEADLDGLQTAAAVQADEDEAKRLGVEGTPTFFVNGKVLEGAQPYDVLKKAVDEALTR
jgi:protein-disulfide isomerase